MIELVAAVHAVDRPIERRLRRSRDRIGSPSRWTQHAYAVDADGRGVPTLDPSACRWCAGGALMAEGDDGRARSLLLEVIGITSPGYSVGDFNDVTWRKHVEILIVFDRAIALARERGL
jgi:hypothetical protein